MSEEGAGESTGDGSEADEEVLVSVRDLATHYDAGGFRGDPVRAVDGVSFDVRRGETLGLVGESGCGKTTLARTLVGLEWPTAGVVRYDGRDVTALSGEALARWRRKVGIVLQDPSSSLNDRMTVGEIVREPLDVQDWPALTVRVAGEPGAAVTGAGTAIAPGNAATNADVTVDPDGRALDVSIRDAIPLARDDVRVGITRADAGSQAGRGRGGPPTVDLQIGPSKAALRRQRVRDVLAAVGLAPEHERRYPHQFSVGQRQRVAIARALAGEPEFVVLDEPVSALDVAVQAKILNLLGDLQARFDVTYLLVAHDLAVVRHVCDRVAVMYLGNLLEVGPTASTFADPANPYTHALLSAIPEPDPTSDREAIPLPGAPPSPRYLPTGCPLSTRCPAKIRPDDLPDLDEETWLAVEELVRVLEARHRADRPLRERVQAALGLSTSGVSAAELIVEVFGDVAESIPESTDERTVRATIDGLDPRLSPHVERVHALVEDGREGDALAYLDENLGSECDRTHPDFHEVDENGENRRHSACHRHRDEFESTSSVLARRYESQRSGGGKP